MNGWIVAYLVLHFMGLGIFISRHGEPRKEPYNMWVAIVSSVITLTLLYKGGAFS